MNFTPFRIAAIYFFFAMVWILVTDHFFALLADNIQHLYEFHTIKGVLYIITTTILLYALLKRYERGISQEKVKLREKDRSLNLALNSAKMATWEYFVDSDSYITSENHNEIFWLEKDHVLKLDHSYEIVHPEDLDRFKKAVENTLKYKKDFNIEYRIRNSEGEVRWLWGKGVAYPNADKNKVSGVTIDITAKKELEEKLELEREKFEKLFDKIPVLIDVFDPEGIPVSLNNEFTKVLGWNEKDIQENDLLELCYPDPESRREAVEHSKKKYMSWKEFKVTTKSGDVRDQLWTNIQLIDGTMVGIGYDITERKKLEEQIKAEREELITIFNNMPVFIHLRDKENTLTEVNKFFEEKLGYSHNDIGKLDLLKLITTDEDYKPFLDHLKKDSGTWEDFKLVTKDGRLVQTTWTNVKISDSKSLGIGLDITDRKTMEEKLKNHKERLQLTTRSGNVGLWEWYPQTGETNFNEVWANLIGYTLDELEPVSIETWNSKVHPEDLKKFEKEMERYFAGETPIYECEIRMKHKNGEWVYILDRGRTVECDENDNPYRVLGTHVDITARIHFERENRLLANVFVHSNTALSVSNPQTNKILRINQAYADLCGYDRNDMIGMHEKKLYPAQARKEFNRQLEKLKNGHHSTFETILKRKDGTEFYALVNLAMVHESKDETSYRVTTVQDISELKRFEDQLIHERQRFEVASKIVSDVVWEWNPQSNYLWWGDGMETVFGYKKEEYEGDKEFWDNHIHKDDRERAISSMNDAENSGAVVWNEEYRFIAADGSVRDVVDKARILRDRKGNIIRIIGSMVDVTELKKNRDRYKKAEEIANIGHWQREIKTDKAIWSDGFYNNIELEKGERDTSFQSLLEMMHPDDRDNYKKAFKKALNTGFLKTNYRLIKQKSGETGFFHELGEVDYDESGNVISISGTIQDITEMAQYQARLRESEELLRRTFESFDEAVIILEPGSRKILDCNRGVEKIFGYTRGELIGSTTEKLHVDREKAEEFSRMSTKDLQEREIFHTEYVMKKKNGEVFYTDYTVTFVHNNEEEVIRVVSVVRDISQKKAAELKLKASEEQYRLLFEQSPIAMWIFDKDTLEFITTNNAAVEKYGYSKQEINKLKVYDLHPEEDRQKVIKEISISLQEPRTGFDIWTQETKNGEKRIVEISGSDIFYQGKVRRLIIAIDITEQQKAEKRAISAIIEGEERERKRIAKELHDGLGQYLSAANMNLETVYEDMPLPKGHLRFTFKNGLEMLEHAIYETRAISQNLLPKAIQDYGLELAVESLINQLNNIHKEITFRFYGNLNGADLTEKIQINLYRIVQEALNNSIRHGKPEKVDIQLVCSENEILLSIEDNGKGFDINSSNGNGIGLRSMKTRVGAMSANLDIASTKDRGTIISVVVPL